MAGIKRDGTVIIDVVAVARKLIAVSKGYGADKGRRFGTWTVIDPFAGRDRGGRRLLAVRCDCGTERTMRLGDLQVSGRCNRCWAAHLSGFNKSAEGRERARHAAEAVREQFLAWARSPENRARMAELARSPENRARLRSPENLARLAANGRSPENLARLATFNRSPEHLARLAEWRNSPEGQGRLAEWRNSPENRARLAERARSPEARARAAQLLREFLSIPRTGSLREPVYACPDCSPGDGRILAFRTKEEETKHFSGYPHGKGPRAEVGILTAESIGRLAMRRS